MASVVHPTPIFTWETPRHRRACPPPGSSPRCTLVSADSPRPAGDPSTACSHKTEGPWDKDGSSLDRHRAGGRGAPGPCAGWESKGSMPSSALTLQRWPGESLVAPATVSALSAPLPPPPPQSRPRLVQPPPHPPAQTFTAHSPLHKLQASRGPFPSPGGFYPGQSGVISPLGIHPPYIHLTNVFQPGARYPSQSSQLPPSTSVL